jgi:CRISPR system Cascade subunit CasA
MTSLNLIRDPWIPVRHRSGRLSTRAPWDVIGNGDDPVVAISTPRADLDGGIVQLLLGLLQTVMPPRHEDEWADRAENPPSPDELLPRLAPLAPAFELLGPDPRVLQDPRVAASGGEPWPVEKLLIDLGLSEGADHFVRSGSARSLCLQCAAAALWTLQNSAPTGGRGHLTSLRGGGPLTTLVVPADPAAPLWTTLWLNLLPLSALRATPPDLASLGAVLPWMAAGDSDEPGRPPELTPEDAHPLQAYFGMPRRLWLGDPREGDCGLCGRTALPTLADFQTRPNGIRYTGAWDHPLSPYRRLKDGQWIARKGDEHGIGYRHWLGLAVAPHEAGVRPARVVAELLRGGPRFEVAGDLRLWAFGYAMDNMKAKAWSEGRMPLYQLPAEIADAFAAEVRMLVEGAELAESYLRFAFKKLIARRPGDVKREPADASARFWEATEPAFWTVVAQLFAAKKAGEDSLPLRRSWHWTLVRACQTLFNQEVAEADFRAAEPGQIARAWNDLGRSLYGKKLKGLLDLPIERSKPKKGGRT